MELGLILPNSGELGTPEAIARISERAEACGLAALWTADHLAPPLHSSEKYPYAPGREIRLDPDHPFVEPLIALAYSAARTQKIALGVSVYLSALRHPIVCAKLLASLDHLAPGRVRLGVGAGWIREEYEQFGIAWAERGAVLDEHIQALRALWNEPRPQFRGRFYRFDEIGFRPQPKPGAIPILIGGNGEAALRRAARLGDGWHPIDLSATEFRAGVSRLDALCAQAGRARHEIHLSMRCSMRLCERPIAAGEWRTPLTGTREELIAELRALEAAGLDHAALWPTPPRLDLAGYLGQIDWIARELAPIFPIASGSRS